MKTKMITLLVIFGLVTFSCAEDFHGNGNDDQEIELTPTNYVYEGDMYLRHLTVEIGLVEQTISDLQDIIDNNQADQQTLDMLQEAEDQLTYFGLELDALENSTGFLVAPRPQPCPEEDILKDLCFPDWEKFLFDSRADIQSFKVFGENGGLLHDFENFETMKLQGFDGEILIQCNTSLKNASGPITFLVERSDRQGNLISYQL